MNIIGNPKYLHIGTKAVLAHIMTRGEYNLYRGWTIPENEDPSEQGYLVEYMDGGAANHPDHVGYISWSPTCVFKDAYQPSGQLSFGHAIELLKAGKRVARSGWNGKGMSVQLRQQTSELNAHLVLQNVHGTFDTWVPSISDLLAEDWVIAG